MARGATTVHAGLYRATGGKFMNTVASLPVLLLTTYGRKTGKPYTTPVCYVRDGQDYLVAATAGGADWEPGWSLNMREQPQAKIEVSGEEMDVTARFTEAMNERASTRSSRRIAKTSSGTSRRRAA
jgi:deazaflavin-dependent oxidoreductase (nitroreductase family)